MGKIRERLKRVAYAMSFANIEEAMSNSLGYAGVAIEAEFKALDKKIEKQGYRVDEVIGEVRSEAYELESRIKELESKCKDIDYLKVQDELNLKNLAILNNTLDHLCIDAKEEVFPSPATDKDGNPPGGLEKWDVISYIVTDRTCKKHFGKRVLGQFCEGKGKWLYGYWGFWDSGGLCSEPYPMLKDRVTFEFRPKQRES